MMPPQVTCGGIATLTPGIRTCEIRPFLGDLKWAKESQGHLEDLNLLA
jgi:hypothetical protein